MLKSRKEHSAEIAFLGSGNMAEAMIKGILDAGLYRADEVLASDLSKSRLESLRSTYGIRTTASNSEAVRKSGIIILSVKPLSVDAVLEEISPELGGKLLISVAAGVTIARIASHLPESSRMIRAMPNAPAKVQSGASVLSPGKGLDQASLDLALKIFSVIGKAWVLDEGQMDAVTGLSGSGPAFIFVIIEALSDGGLKAGLPREMATQLAAQTVLGAAKMVLQLNEHPAKLKDLVTSPAGTTIAGLHQLEAGKIRASLMNAVEAAVERSKALGI